MNAVEFDRVSKSYAIYDKPADRLKEVLGSRSRHREFQALRDVSFEVRRGEVFCVIGENGSGKSTALQIVAGIMQPTRGEARMNGRAAALLELGAGFNPEFTGRENVYLNASILGLSRRDVDTRFSGIEEFAEIGDFIDQPVKTYSSGMTMRLAFAVAINVDPEILIVDEALAVGDAYFRHRCMRKVQELRARGLTILFVSHSMADVKSIGDRALWLRHGETAALGAVDRVVADYLNALGKDHRVPAMPAVETVPNVDRRHGDGRAEILGFAVSNEFGEPLRMIDPDTTVTIRIAFRAVERLAEADAGFLIRNHLGCDFSETSASQAGNRIPALAPGEKITIDFQLQIPELYPASFSFSPWIRNQDAVCDWIDNALTLQMARGEKTVYGYIQPVCRIEVNQEIAVG